jgi:hypothetical protein
MITTIYVDECGYTGEDLFNPEQPIFCLASTSLSVAECAALISAHMSGVKAGELKHSSLTRNNRHQKRVVGLLREIAHQHNSTVRFAIVHKRFALLTKIVDLIIEPLAYEDGIDFYDRGLNIAYSNALYYMTRSLVSEKFFLQMIQNFQKMMRDRTQGAYDHFFRLFFDTELPRAVAEMTIFLKGSHIKHGQAAIRSIPPDSLDIAFGEAFNLIAKWSEDIKGELLIIHDQSSNMARSKHIWDRVVSPDVPERVVGKDKRLMRFPLRVVRTELANSKMHAGLQIVDILAGAMTRCMKWIISGQNPTDEYAAELASFFPESFGGHMLWPNPEFTPEDLGTTGPSADDAIDHMVDLIKDLL